MWLPASERKATQTCDEDGPQGPCNPRVPCESSRRELGPRRSPPRPGKTLAADSLRHKHRQVRQNCFPRPAGADLSEPLSGMQKSGPRRRQPLKSPKPQRADPRHAQPKASVGTHSRCQPRRLAASKPPASTLLECGTTLGMGRCTLARDNLARRCHLRFPRAATMLFSPSAVMASQSPTFVIPLLSRLTPAPPWSAFLTIVFL